MLKGQRKCNQKYFERNMKKINQKKEARAGGEEKEGKKQIIKSKYEKNERKEDE